MALFDSASDLYDAQKARILETQRRRREGNEESARLCFNDLRELTDGGVGPNGAERRAWLSANGHPYARRHFAKGKNGAYSTTVPLLPIGKISGELSRRLGIQGRGDQVRVGWFRSVRRYFTYVMYGTWCLVARGLWDEALSRRDARRPEIIERYYRAKLQ